MLLDKRLKLMKGRRLVPMKGSFNIVHSIVCWWTTYLLKVQVGDFFFIWYKPIKYVEFPQKIDICVKLLNNLIVECWQCKRHTLPLSCSQGESCELSALSDLPTFCLRLKSISESETQVNLKYASLGTHNRCCEQVCVLRIYERDKSWNENAWRKEYNANGDVHISILNLRSMHTVHIGAWFSERLRRWSNKPDVVGSIPVTTEFFLI